jgi:hypothetical protein
LRRGAELINPARRAGLIGIVAARAVPGAAQFLLRFAEFGAKV